MKYIETLRDGDTVRGIYLCKQRMTAMTKNGKPYENVILQDKTGVIDGKIWTPNSMGIMDFDALDYIDVTADVTTFNGSLQMNIKGVRVAEEGEYHPADYLPSSRKDIEVMYQELLDRIKSVKNENLRKLLEMIFIEDTNFVDKFKKHSAAKTIHHSFIGGLLEHTLSVTNLCEYFSKAYPVLNHDLLLTAAMLHDIGKVYELSSFPQNDYTDSGQLLGHIVMGYEMVGQKIKKIEGFPAKTARELLHCILAHHGELEYGSPKKPALPEAFALNLADNADAKLETLSEILLNTKPADGSEWYGFNRVLDSNLRKSTID
ncbi:MAG: HD domain-containing protein [Lachnospiraceae bacterium]|nr:HD domain-containing protein [Lachnospiraceae bacterium]